ncbi:hypothetical protein DMB42_00065 [Nonomuraea sp. WAC 01424]|uniref:hypothetical protein n=1 Tax=Nonomuraea sp. WAC 01424 TaxID=2203200 RepID=UPI000F7929F4|nr:hypothetical protein [Nonomuraea sp. WAC 01424]RSN15310.1 hypothetical protein DMB42_00065 [Nonomuraea sp. WAC 01424]
MHEIELVERMRAQIPLPDPGELAARIDWRPERRPPRRRARVRLLVLAPVTAALAAVVLTALSALPPGAATSYANAAIAVTQEDGEWVARIKDPLAESAKYTEAFGAVGLDVGIQLVPASPARVGDLVLVEGVRPSGDFRGGLEPEGCRVGQAGCHLTFRVPAGFKGPVRAQLGRPAAPGEPYQAAARATDPGEMLEGVTVEGRPVGELLAEIRERGLTVVYQRVRDDPASTDINFADGRRGEFHLTYEPVGAADVGEDWLVWNALPDREGVVRLQVTPYPLRPGNRRR